MAHFYGNNQIEKLKERIDIVNVIESYLPLKKTGAYFTACCPFHEEKTPSFVVYPDSQTFYCYGGGCHKGGDVIHFVQEIDKLSFAEAVEMLADRAGITLVPDKKSTSGPSRSLKKEMFQANTFALSYFRDSLHSEQGARGRSYLAERGISEETIDRFSIGFGKAGLTGEIRRNKLDIEPFVKTGLIQNSSRSSSYYEPFRNRLIFPIKDVRGRVTGFGARVLEKKFSGGKYINSPASPVFNKKQNLYGIEFLKQMDEGEPAVIVEGYTDVIGLVQNGFMSAAATLGTALTEDHLKKLRRFTDSVIMIFDGDEAGIKAAEKSIGLFIEKEMDASFVTLPNEQDPCEFVMEQGVAPFREQLKSARTMYDFKKDILSKRFKGGSTGSISKIIEHLAHTFGKTASSVKRELFFKQIASDFEVSVASVEEISAPEKPSKSRTDARHGTTSGSLLQDAMSNILQSIIMHPSLFETAARKLHDEIIPEGHLKNIYSACLHQYRENGSLVPDTLFSHIEDTEESGIISTYLHGKQDLKYEVAEQLLEESITYLKLKDYEKEIEKLKKKRSEAERSGNDKMERKYQYQLNVIYKHKQTLTGSQRKHSNAGI